MDWDRIGAKPLPELKKFISAYMRNQVQWIDTLRPIQNDHRFPDDIFKYIFLNENVWISISLKFVIIMAQ